MFHSGFGELLLILLISLIVLGPKRLPEAIEKIAFFIKQLKKIWHSVLASLNTNTDNKDGNKPSH